MAIFKKFNKTENRDIYWIDYYDENGIRRRESTGSGSHSFAKEFLNKKLDAVAHRRKKLPDRYVPKVNFSEFVDNEYIPIHAKGSKYESNMRGICNKLKVYFGDRCLHEIDSRMVEIYKKERMNEVAENTIVSSLSGRKNTIVHLIRYCASFAPTETPPFSRCYKLLISRGWQELMIMQRKYAKRGDI